MRSQLLLWLSTTAACSFVMSKKSGPKIKSNPTADKNPKFASNPSVGKNPKVSSNPEFFYDLNPTWRVAQIELCDPFGWHILPIDQFSYVKEKLSNFESMTWRDILVDGRKFNHLIETDKLIKPARDRLEELGQNDLEEILSLRLSGKERVWGVLDRGSLNLLWWDPDHKICPSPKKHT